MVISRSAAENFSQFSRSPAGDQEVKIESSMDGRERREIQGILTI